MPYFRSGIKTTSKISKLYIACCYCCQHRTSVRPFSTCGCWNNLNWTWRNFKNWLQFSLFHIGFNFSFDYSNSCSNNDNSKTIVNILTLQEHHSSRPSPGREFCSSTRRVHILLKINQKRRSVTSRYMTGLSFYAISSRIVLETW